MVGYPIRSDTVRMNKGEQTIWATLIPALALVVIGCTVGAAEERPGETSDPLSKNCSELHASSINPLPGTPLTCCSGVDHCYVPLYSQQQHLDCTHFPGGICVKTTLSPVVWPSYYSTARNLVAVRNGTVCAALTTPYSTSWNATQCYLTVGSIFGAGSLSTKVQSACANVSAGQAIFLHKAEPGTPGASACEAVAEVVE